MAAGDISVQGVDIVGNRRVVFGELEADDTNRNFAITDTNSTLIDLVLTCQVRARSPGVKLNVNTSAAATRGMATIQNETDNQKFQFRATVV